MIFKDMSKIKTIGKEIYVYENFLSIEECDSIYNILKNMPDEEWHTRKDYPIPAFSKNLDETKIIFNKLKNVILAYDVFLTESFVKLNKGDFWGEHSDNADFEETRKKSLTLKDNEPFEIVDNTAYGIVVYINDNYQGGEIYYPTQNIVYKPKAGDLVVHSAEDLAVHGVQTVIDGTRFSYSSHLSTELKVPLNG